MPDQKSIIYLFSPIPYHFLHQRPQKLADEFVSQSYRLVFVQPSTWQSYLRGERKGFLRALLRSVWYHCVALLSFVVSFGPARKRENHPSGPALIFADIPLGFPLNKFNVRILDALNMRVFRVFLDRLLRLTISPLAKTVAIVEHPFWGRIIRKDDFTTLLYDCIDAISVFAGKNSIDRFMEFEKSILSIADAIIVTAHELEQRLKLATSSKKIVRVPNAVDYERFQRITESSDVPEDLRSILRPMAGYVGALYSWLDYTLLFNVISAELGCNFVFVGPVGEVKQLAKIQRLPNFHLLGLRIYSDIPKYINAFDVCLIPFQLGEIARSTNPVKVFEYFALGKPVVSTPLFELREFVSEGLVYEANSTELFRRKLHEALAERDTSRAARRREVARLNSWKNRVQVIEQLFNAPVRHETV